MLTEQAGGIELYARVIYEEILPETVSKYSSIHYHRSSPYSGHGRESNDLKYGDAHQWNVWHGSQEPWHNWDKLAGRFVSEFGMSVIVIIITSAGVWELTFPTGKHIQISELLTFGLEKIRANGIRNRGSAVFFYATTEILTRHTEPQLITTKLMVLREGSSFT